MITGKLIRFSAPELIDILYKAVLKRNSDLQGRDFHTQALCNSEGDPKTILRTINSFVDSDEARNNFFTRDALKFLNLTPNFEDVISLGDHCLTSYLLKIYSLKSWSSPFDWLFSSPNLIADCLNDDFKTFLDTANYESANNRDDDSTDGRTIHLYYREKFGISHIFNHHDLTQPEQYDYFRRCVDRFRLNAKSHSKKLYLCLYDENAYSIGDITSLAYALSKYSKNYTFAAIEICKKNKSTDKIYTSDEKITPERDGFYHYRYLTQNKAGPLRLTNIEEELGIFRAIMNFDKHQSL
jgi:Putative papain-like cysteine peptidase (DUF1796)